MKKLKRTYTRCALTASLVLLVLLVAGSIWDLPISKFLYPGHESSLGQFFAAFGELPAFSLLAGCGVLLIVHRAKFRPELNVILLAFGVCLTLASMFLAVHEATDNVSALPMAVALLVTVFIDALTAFALLFLTRECQTKTILRFVCTVIVVCVGIMLLILLPTLYRRQHNKEKLFMAIGGVWTLAVAVSRLRMGMHFLSDVSVSSLLTIALGAVAVWLFYFNKSFFNKIWAFASGDPKPAKKPRTPEEP